MKFIRSVKYIINRFVLRRRFLVAQGERYGIKLKFKTEDVVGRHIYKKGDYEEHISEFISNEIKFEEGDVSIDVGANIGWYSVLLAKIMPNNSRIYAFEPDPLNYELLTSNIKLNNVSNVLAVNKALAEKNEIKKLYRYSSKNLGRHSLLDINSEGYVNVHTLVLDDFLLENKVNLEKVKFIKIDIEGYEYFALCGARNVLKNVKCLISEFVPRHMINGGVDPVLLINLLLESGLKPSIVRNGGLICVSRDELLSQEACDIVWKR